MPEPRHSSRQASCASAASASSSQSSACGWDTTTAPSSAAAVGAQARRAGEDRVADGRRDLAIAAGEHLGEEERVARRAAVELVGVDAVRLGELRDGVGRQPRELAARDAARPWPALRARPAAGGAGRARRRGRCRARAPAPCRPSAASSRRTSRVASSAQCRSSSTRTVGARRASSRNSASATSCGPAPPAVTCARSPPVSSATSSSGPRARGVNSASHAPHRIRADPRCSSVKRRASAVLPAPASPVTSTSRPREVLRTPSSIAASAVELTRALQQVARLREPGRRCC